MYIAYLPSRQDYGHVSIRYIHLQQGRLLTPMLQRRAGKRISSTCHSIAARSMRSSTIKRIWTERPLQMNKYICSHIAPLMYYSYNWLWKWPSKLNWCHFLSFKNKNPQQEFDEHMGDCSLLNQAGLQQLQPTSPQDSCVPGPWSSSGSHPLQTSPLPENSRSSRLSISPSFHFRIGNTAVLMLRAR